jgi:hypothetical protein
MKPPPLLLFAALLFWGWQTDFLVVGAALGVTLELARLTKFRWELDDADFNRLWSFCVVLNIALVGYVFTNNDTGGLGGPPHGNALANAIRNSQLTSSRFLRWLPMTLFAFVLAQTFNRRPSAPLTAISLVLRWRRRHGDRAFAGRFVDVSYPYFIVCVFSASIQTNTGNRSFFLGLCALLVWALWSNRPQRYGIFAWAAAVAAIAGLGVFGVVGIRQAQRGLMNLQAEMISRLIGNRTDPLQSMTSMGRIGRLKLSAKIVVWLEPHEVGHVPEYLREASYRNFQTKNMGWYAGSVKDFEPFNSETNGATWNLLPGKKNSDVVNISCYLTGRAADTGDPEGLLPLPSGSSVLEKLPVFSLKANRLGTVLAAGLGLVIFDAHYGPGATLDSLPDVDSTNHYDLVVPKNEVEALQQAIAEISLPATASREEKLRAVQKFFFDKFTYSTWQGADKKATTNASPLTKFLTTSRSGHCEYFASATVLLLRQMNIPARYAVGYSIHETRGTGYIARERDAHAWCLVWNEGKNCWEDFDTTPPSWVAIESERTRFGEWFADLRSWAGFQFAKFRWRQANWQQYIVWALVPVLLVLLYHIIFKRRKKLPDADGRGKHAAQIVWPGMDSEFFQLEKKLAARGLPRSPGETASAWLSRALAEPALTNLRTPVAELLRLHYRHRFDPEGLPLAERERLRRETKACLDALLQLKA